MNDLDSKKICCIIITYNPTSNIYALIEAIQNQVGFIIIVDNNSAQCNKSNFAELNNASKINIIYNDQNFGIAKALNQGINKAKQLHFEWVITFDQDTIPFNNIIKNISEAYEAYPRKEKLGFIGTNFPASNKNRFHEYPDHSLYYHKDYLITSGSLMSISTFNEVGGFREDLFIDNVDLEYSLRLRKYGRDLIITKKWGMIHKAGDPCLKKFFGISVSSSNHNSFRRYFMARNHIILSKEYFVQFPYFILKLNYFFLWSLIKILFVEEDKKSKIKSSIKGLYHGLINSTKNELPLFLFIVYFVTRKQMLELTNF